MKVALLANCQALGLSKSLQALLGPDVEISAYRYNDMPTRQHAENVAEQVKEADLVFSQLQGMDRFGPVRTAALRESRSGVFGFPPIVVSAFQPDMIYVGPGANTLPGPFGLPYHSSIAIAAFAKGYSVSRTRALYNGLVFGRLGFMDILETEIARLDAHFAVDGMRVKWPSPAIGLMHTFNHPSIFMLGAAARALCGAAGLGVRDIGPGMEGVPDDLGMATVWPVYPAIARKLDIAGGGYVFRRANKTGQERFTYFDLDEMITSAFEVYRTWTPAQLAAARVGHVMQVI